ncbi:MAG: hypothetical protein V1704_00690 [Candidatus Vogelbacteria bacterium]
MKFFALLGHYLTWHYTTGLLDCLRLLANFLWFVYHFFSVPVIARTLFSPWRRLDEAYRGGFDPQRALETFIVNLLMRVFGFVVRMIFLLVALVVLAAVFVLGLLIILIFFLAPVIIIGSFALGFYLLFLT